ncbi:TPA_asm: LO6 [Tilapia adomavirus 2]|uniref:LO6 n=1 Tax=Tilapia adomavirus 2 TaxID=2597804 RepID=A0A5H3CUK1_9VIRU|nr:TPA_asm: LO6 [Tilapia adomavirus 2]
MRRTGYYAPRASESDSNAAYEQYFLPYVQTHTKEICTLIKKKVNGRLQYYYTLTDPGQVTQEILNDVLEAVQEHMTSYGGVQRGAGISSFFKSLFSWLMPRATRLVQVIPKDIKDAALQAATDVTVTGINAVANRAKHFIDPSQQQTDAEPRGGALQTCVNAAMCHLCENDKRGGFIGGLLSALATLAPAVIGMITDSAASKRGAGFGPYWRSIYPYPDDDSTRGGKVKRKRKGHEMTSVPMKREYYEDSGTAGSHWVQVCSHPMGDCYTPVTLTVTPETKARGKNKGGRPIIRKGFCRRSDLDML